MYSSFTVLVAVVSDAACLKTRLPPECFPTAFPTGCFPTDEEEEAAGAAFPADEEEEAAGAAAFPADEEEEAAGAAFPADEEDEAAGAAAVMCTLHSTVATAEDSNADRSDGLVPTT
jgi:hypothetical protein